jgi:hypothetical protein
MNDDRKRLKNKRKENPRGLSKEELARIIHNSAIDIFLSNSEKGLYEPLETLKKGNMYTNFIGFKKVYLPEKSLKEVSADFLVEFARETNRKIGVHPAYILSCLGMELENTKKFSYEAMNKVDENIKKEISTCIEMYDAILSILPEAMKKLLSKPPAYLV